MDEINEDIQDNPQPEEAKNPFAEEAEGEVKVEAKKPRANIITLKSDDLCQNPLGLTYLYQRFVDNPVSGEKGTHNSKLKLKGKGHELSDFNRIMDVYKNWHATYMPKLEYNYFVERISKNSGNRVCREQMVKLRKVYTGQEALFFELVAEQNDLAKEPEVIFSYEKADAQNASKMREQELSRQQTHQQQQEFHFRMHDDQEEAEQIIDTTSRPQPNLTLSSDQLKAIEERRRWAMERKRQTEMQEEQQSAKKRAKQDTSGAAIVMYSDVQG